MYILLTVAGVLVLVAPTLTVADSLATLLAHIWAYFFILGGTFSTYGLIRGVLWGEALGLPMASASTLMYGIIITERFVSDESGLGALIIGMLFIAYAFGLVGRWIEVMHILRIARQTK